MYNSMINNKHVFRNHALNESNVKGGARLLAGSVSLLTLSLSFFTVIIQHFNYHLLH